MAPGIMQTLQNNSIKMTLRNFEVFDRMRLFPMEQYAIQQPSLYNPQPIVKVTLAGETKYAIKVRIEKVDNIKMSLENNRWKSTVVFGTDTSINILDIGTKQGKDWRDISIQIIMRLTNLSLPLIENTNPAYCIFCYNVRRGIDRIANAEQENPDETEGTNNAAGKPKAKNASKGTWKKSPTVPGFEEHLKKIINDLQNPANPKIVEAKEIIIVDSKAQNQVTIGKMTGKQHGSDPSAEGQVTISQVARNQQIIESIAANQYNAHQYVVNQHGNEQSAGDYAVFDKITGNPPEIVIIDGVEYEVLQPARHFVQNADDDVEMDVIIVDQNKVEKLDDNSSGAHQLVGSQNQTCKVVDNIDVDYEMDKRFDEWVSRYKAQVKDVYHPTVVFKFS
ncbi:hypothetical protein CAEBREN_20873 [Caenorhabditis brenneri]|uniref:Uncharacterized protein n=1 Tax=Caenorhabditis brenneri TaxID=135651 RepID=G0MYD9_CAEBE|nr:hypothetical protein CAEBREN_20873 [Caenorhabditis brenneri]